MLFLYCFAGQGDTHSAYHSLTTSTLLMLKTALLVAILAALQNGPHRFIPYPTVIRISRTHPASALEHI